MAVEFDFSRLKGRITEKFGSSKALAEYLQMTPTALSRRLNNITPFQPEDIHAMCAQDCLDIDSRDIGVYFFTPKVLFLEP